LGPFGSSRAAELAAAALYDALPLRQCTAKLSARTTSPACVLAELARCPAPCQHRISVPDYAARAVEPFRSAAAADPGPVVDGLLASAETVRPGPGPTPCATPEETERVLAWLERDGTRLVQTTHGWSLPAAGASRFRNLLIQVEQAATQPYVHQ